MKTWHWIALGGIVAVALVVYKRMNIPATQFMTGAPGDAPPAAPAPGPASATRTGRGHF